MLRGLVAQRLVRRICPDCARPHIITEGESELLSHAIAAGEEVRRGTGCDTCHGTGFRGRLPIYEIIEVTPALERLVHDGASEAELEKAARQTGPGMLGDGIAKLRAGRTTVEEVVRVVYEDTSYAVEA